MLGVYDILARYEYCMNFLCKRTQFDDVFSMTMFLLNSLNETDYISHTKLFLINPMNGYKILLNR